VLAVSKHPTVLMSNQVITELEKLHHNNSAILINVVKSRKKEELSALIHLLGKLSIQI
jgi:hypothetical protein